MPVGTDQHPGILVIDGGIVKWILYFHYGVAGFMAVVSCIAAFLEGTNTMEPPEVDPGFYAAFIALCVASIAAVEHVRSSVSLRTRLITAGVGVGLICSAYLWLADEAGSHPASLELLASMGIVWSLSAALVLFVFLVALFVRSEDR